MSKDLKKLTDVELKKALEEKRRSLLDLRFSMTGSTKRNAKDSSTMKKEVARMLTEQQIRGKK